MIHNTWLWFHILAGGILARIFLIWFQPQLCVILVLAVAMLWELYEYLSSDWEKIYGSRQRWFLDSAEDIFGAFIMAIIVVL